MMIVVNTDSEMLKMDISVKNWKCFTVTNNFFCHLDKVRKIFIKMVVLKLELRLTKQVNIFTMYIQNI